MVGMEMSQDNVPDITRADSKRAELWTEFFLGMHGEVHRAAVERMPARMVTTLVHTRGLAGVHDDDPLVVLDDPGEDRQPGAPFLVEQHVGDACWSLAARFHLRAPHLYEAGPDGVESCHVLCSLSVGG